MLKGLMAGAIGFSLVVIPLSIRCTRLNEGQFCAISNNGEMNILLGHHGRIGGIEWHDTRRGLSHIFGSPAAAQHGYTGVIHFDFGVYDRKQNLWEAKNWIRAHPKEALLLSVEHVTDLFYGTIPWPTSHTPQRRWSVWFQKIYWIFILLPACVYLIGQRRSILQLRDDGLADLLMILPIIGLMVTVFIACGEPRYRIPFDGFMIILAARWYAETFRELPH